MTETFQTMATDIIDGLTAERDAARAMACFYHESLRRIAAIGKDGPSLVVLAGHRAELAWLKLGEGR